MTVSTPAVSLTQSHNSHQVVPAAGEPAPKEQSLGVFSPQNWIVEWSGQKGRQILHAAIMANAFLLKDLTSVVVDYLKKNDIFGLGELETAWGGKKELAKVIGEYAPEKPLPPEVDDEMQAPLTQYFGAKALRDFHEYRASNGMPQISRMSELYSLYWGPAKMTANIAEQLGKKRGARFAFFWKDALQEHGNAPTSANCWIAFPNDVFGRGKRVRELKSLIPAGFEFPHFQEAAFCIFMRFGCTGERIMPDLPSTRTFCQEMTSDLYLCVGNFDDTGLRFSENGFSESGDASGVGIAPLRKFCVKD